MHADVRSLAVQLMLLNHRIRFSVAIVVFFCFVLVVPSIADEKKFEEQWADTISWIHEEFPSVQHISTDQLAQLLAERDDITLLDTREQEEYEVSHIQDAALATDVNDALEILGKHDKGRIVVVYCSVGYRSSKIAEILARRGVPNVFNLEGSLFQWANEGRPLYQGASRVNRVHPFDDEWGKLLDQQYWP